MLHLTDAFLVCPLLLLFTPLVAFHQWDVSVALGKMIKHFYIQESPLLLIPPKTSSLDIYPGVIIGDCTAQRHPLSQQCLKGWFHSNTMTYSVMRLAVMFLSSLHLIMGKPPVGQLKACSTPNGFPHIQCEARSFGSHPYLRHRASWNALLYRVKPWSCKGRMVSQVEVPRDPSTAGNVMVAVIE